MHSAHISVDPPGWLEWFVLLQEDGARQLFGRGPDHRHGIPKGDLVVMRQPSLEAAVERVRLRGGQFIKARTQP